MLVFLHTSPVHVQPFGLLVEQLDGAVPVRHVVEQALLADALLTDALAAGPTSELVRAGVDRVLRELARDGAKVIVCTCSTIGALIEAAVVPNCTVMRVDRPAAEHAIASGRRIVVVAALPTALEQTLVMLQQVSVNTRCSSEIVEALCQPAWEYFERGNLARYLTEIAHVIDSVAVSGDLVLLAQASMAPVVSLVGRTDISILASPRLGVEAALAAYRAR